MVPVLNSDPLVGRCVNDLADGASEKSTAEKHSVLAEQLALTCLHNLFYLLLKQMRERPKQRQWKHVIGSPCSTVCKSSRCFCDTSYRQELLKPKFTPDVALTRGACFFSALFILQLQARPVRWKIRSTRDAAFLSLGVNRIFLLSPLRLTPFFKR